MSSVDHLYVLVWHPYVTRMSSACTHMSSVCTRMSPVCQTYFTRLWFYHEPCQNVSNEVFFTRAQISSEHSKPLWRLCLECGIVIHSQSTNKGLWTLYLALYLRDSCFMANCNKSFLQNVSGFLLQVVTDTLQNAIAVTMNNSYKRRRWWQNELVYSCYRTVSSAIWEVFWVSHIFQLAKYEKRGKYLPMFHEATCEVTTLSLKTCCS